MNTIDKIFHDQNNRTLVVNENWIFKVDTQTKQIIQTNVKELKEMFNAGECGDHIYFEYTYAMALNRLQEMGLV